MSDNQRHPDIEIYIKDRSLEQITSWLGSICKQLENEHNQGQIHNYFAQMDTQTIPIMIHEKVSGKAWTSVWFNSDQSPWQKDLDCAMQAAKQLDTQVRCIASGWNTGDDPDEWWKVENSGETSKMQWRT